MGQIRTSDVRRAAAIVEGVARVVRQEVPVEVGGIASAMSGTRSAEAGSRLVNAWTESYQQLATKCDEHAVGMRRAADDFDAADADAAGTYNRFPGFGTTPWFGPNHGASTRPSSTPPVGSPIRAERFVAGGTEPV